MWSEEDARRYVPQASGLPRPLPPARFPEPNVPGGGSYMMYTQVQVQVTQQPSYQQPPPHPPPSQFPVPPTYPSGYAGAIPRIAPQFEMGHVNYHTRSPAALSHARAPEHPPPYFDGGFDGGFVTSGRPEPLNPQGPPYGGRGPSYVLVPSHAPETRRTHPQVYVRQTA
jgi:hypothetical protein